MKQINIPTSLGSINDIRQLTVRHAQMVASLAEMERQRDWYKDLHKNHCGVTDCDDTPPWNRTDVR